jgi:hypothetical protein
VGPLSPRGKPDRACHRLSRCANRLGTGRRRPVLSEAGLNQVDMTHIVVLLLCFGTVPEGMVCMLKRLLLQRHFRLDMGRMLFFLAEPGTDQLSTGCSLWRRRMVGRCMNRRSKGRMSQRPHRQTRSLECS